MTVYIHLGDGGLVSTTSGDAARVEPRPAEWLRAMSDPTFVADMEEFLALAEDADAELDIDAAE